MSRGRDRHRTPARRERPSLAEEQRRAEAERVRRAEAAGAQAMSAPVLSPIDDLRRAEAAGRLAMRAEPKFPALFHPHRYYNPKSRRYDGCGCVRQSAPAAERQAA